MRIFRQVYPEQDGGPARERGAGAVHRHAPPRAAAAAPADGAARGAAPRDCHGMTLSIAIDYGGRDELTRAVRALSHEVACGALAAVGDLRGDARGGARHLAACPTPTSSSAPRASSASRTSCSGRAPMPSTTSPRPPGPTSAVEAFAEAIEGYRLRSRRFGAVVDVPARAGSTWSAPRPEAGPSASARRFAQAAGNPLQRLSSVPSTNAVLGGGAEPWSIPHLVLHENKPLPLDPRLVARRGDLPDLSALVPGFRTATASATSPGSSIGCPTSRASGSTRSGSRRSSPRRCSTSATT